MKKVFAISLVVLLLLVGVLGLTYAYEYNDNNILKFEFNGNDTINLSLGESYLEYGINVFHNGNDISSMVKIDSSMVDINHVGVYKVKYEVILGDVSEYVYRTVNVRENVAPKIVLKGDSVINIFVNDVYYEPGFEVSDNYDINLEKNVVITSNLDVSEVGEYEIEYKVSDSSGNETKVIRTVIVSK